MIDQDIQDKMHEARTAMTTGDTEAAIATVADLFAEALTHMRRQTKALETLAAAATPLLPDGGVT